MLDPNAPAVCHVCNEPIIVGNRQIPNELCFDEDQTCVICAEPTHTACQSWETSESGNVCVNCYIGHQKGKRADLAIMGAFPDLPMSLAELATLPGVGSGIVVGGILEEADGKRWIIWQIALISGRGFDDHRHADGELWMNDTEVRIL